MRQDGKNMYQISDIQYFGNVEFYSSLIDASHVFFLPEKMYEKSIHLNRTSIYGSNGLIHLSVPLEGGRNQKKLIRDVRIAKDSGWKRIHWRSIHDSYRKAPWFDDLGWQVEQLYTTQQVFLLDWNLKTMEWALRALKLKMDILAEESQQVVDQHTTSLPVAIIQKSELERYPHYQQVFTDRFGFQPNLSILDLLFCEGPGSLAYLKKLRHDKKEG